MNRHNDVGINKGMMSSSGGNERSSSESSASESESYYSEASSNSYGSDDSLPLGKMTAAHRKKLRRLRRIFLNRPTIKQTGRTKRHSPCKTQLKHQRTPLTSPRTSKLSHRSVFSSSSPVRRSTERLDEQELDDMSTNDRPMRLSIDQHIHALCEQVQRLSSQRDATTNQIHTMLEQAIEELQFLKKQEERTLQSQIKLIHESYGLRLEIFEQQYLGKVQEIRQEMRAAIQHQKEKCDLTILAAAKQLQEQTQLALLKELPTSAKQELELDGIQLSLPSNKATQQICLSPSSNCAIGRKHEAPQKYVIPRVEVEKQENDAELSPVAKQKAKLRALEARLAMFSRESIHRAAREQQLHNNYHQNNPITPSDSKQMLQSSSLERQHSIQDQDPNGWQPTPLSPLRKHRSYWRKGISLEKNEHEDQEEVGEGVKRTVTKTKAIQGLSRRFLRPEEEAELQKLRDSIGLANDWMAKHRR